MKKSLDAFLVFILSFLSVIQLSASQEAQSGQLQNGVSVASGQESAPDLTEDIVRRADEYYKARGYTDEQVSQARDEMAKILDGLYLPADSKTARQAAELVQTCLDGNMSGLTADSSAVQLVYYSTLVKWAGDSSLPLSRASTVKGNEYYTVGVNDKSGRRVMTYSVFPTEGSCSAGAYAFEAPDLEIHIAKAYELLKDTELNISQTSAKRFFVKNFGHGYLLEDSKTALYLVFGSGTRGVADAMKPIEGSETNIELNMRIVTGTQLYDCVKGAELENLRDDAIDAAEAMGSTEDETNRGFTVWLFAGVFAVIVALSVAVFAEKKKNS